MINHPVTCRMSGLGTSCRTRRRQDGFGDKTEAILSEYYRTIFTIEDRDIVGLDLLGLVND